MPCKKTYSLLWFQMRLGFARTVLGLSSEKAQAWTNNMSPRAVRTLEHRYRKRYYARLRASGLSGEAASARLYGMTTEAFKKCQRASMKKYDARWGGRPDVARCNRAWVAREAHKLAVKLQAIGG